MAMPAITLCRAMRRERWPRAGFAHPIEPVGGDHHVGRLGGGGGAPGAHGHPDISDGQGRGVVDTVAHHDGRRPPALRADGVKFLGGRPLGQHFVDADDGPHGVGDLDAVPGDHHDPPDTAAPQAPDGLGGVGAHRVVEHQHPDRDAIYGHEHGHGAVQLGPPAGGFGPGGGRRKADPGGFAQRHLPAVHDTPDALASHLDHLIRQCQPAVAGHRGVHHGVGEHVR
jgi:hypothetical protein